MNRYLALLLGLCLCAAPARAADIPWKSREYVHVAKSQPLVELLRLFGADQGISTAISEKVTGKVSGKFGPMGPEQFLNELTSTNGLIWYYDGQTLYINRSDEASTRIVRLRRVEVDSALSTLKGLGIDGGRFPIKALPESKVLYVTGPPRYLELVGQVVEALEEGAEAPLDPTMGIGVYTLKYAWADDQAVTFRNEQVIVPGVATILRNLLAGQPVPQPQSATGFRQQAASLRSLKGTGMRAIGVDDSELNRAMQSERPQDQPGPYDQGAPGQLAGSGPQAPGLQAVPGLPPGAFVQADRRLNAVIIRDTQGKLPAYAKAIKELDRPMGLVEITAAIIDINANSGFDWAPPYLVEWPHNGHTHSFGLNFPATALSTAVSPAFTATLMAKKANEFMLQVKALEKCGLANIQSRPSVLTIDNVEAMLSRTQTYYVRVEGSFTNDLFNVQVGTSLKVMPHIIYNEDGTRKVKLLIDLVDGTVDQRTTTDAIPQNTQNMISTQAVLNEQESLLVGGLFTDTVETQETAVPILGQTPLIGFLFRSYSNQTIRNERVILLTPRIVDLDGLPMGPPGEMLQPGPLVLPDEEPVREPADRTVPPPMPLEEARTRGEAAPRRTRQGPAGPGHSQFRAAPETSPEPASIDLASGRSERPMRGQAPDLAGKRDVPSRFRELPASTKARPASPSTSASPRGAIRQTKAEAPAPPVKRPVNTMAGHVRTPGKKAVNESDVPPKKEKRWFGLWGEPKPANPARPAGMMPWQTEKMETSARALAARPAREAAATRSPRRPVVVPQGRVADRGAEQVPDAPSSRLMRGWSPVPAGE